MRRIALAQIKSATKKAKNLKLAQDLIREAQSKGASVIAFPEFLMAFSPSSQSAQELAQIAEPLDGLFINSLADAAKNVGIDVLATIYETADSSSRVYDTALWINADGTAAAVYRKLHLYDALGFKESDKFLPGNEVAPLVEAAVGRCGIMICYDLRFPELARILTLMGADILLAPSGWVKGEKKIEHWHTMVRARALENGSYVVAPDQVGNIYIGHSLVVDPFGNIVVDMKEDEGLAIIDIDPKLIAETRENLPLLKNRRDDIYLKYITAKTP
ncbi:MAG: carbon-nitrogen hydrolase family protein [Alphaproteobacteria bacterium]